MKIPRLSGRALAFVRAAAEGKGSNEALRAIVKGALGLDRLAALPSSSRAPLRMDMRPERARTETPSRKDAGLPAPKVPATWPRTAGSFEQAYREGSTSPREVAERVIQELDALALRSP